MDNQEKVGLWEKKDKNGNIMFCGKTKDGKKVMIFKNTYKKEDKHPDYNLMISDGNSAPVVKSNIQVEEKVDEVPF
jgi:hypothetical protein